MSAPCTPEQMPDVRLSLLDGWRRPSWKAVAFEGVMRVRRAGLNNGSGWVNPDNYVQWEQQQLERADLWWVAEDMCDVLYAAANNIPDETTVLDLHMTGQCGLVVLERTWVGRDATRPDSMVAVDAFMWGPGLLSTGNGEARPTVSLSSYRYLRLSDARTDNEKMLADLFEINRSLRLSGDNTELASDGAGWIPLGRSDWPLGESVGAPTMALQEAQEKYPDMKFTTVEGEPVSATDVRQQWVDSVIEDRRMIAALWALLNTKSMITKVDRPADRPARRRSARAGVTAPSNVNIVYLRRPQSEPHDDSEPEHAAVNWSHRWIVNAHPRLQPYGPGRRQRKLIMVAPHVKGPADKPLVVKPTVRAVVR